MSCGFDDTAKKKENKPVVEDLKARGTLDLDGNADVGLKHRNRKPFCH